MIRLTDLEIARGGRSLLQEVHVIIERGERIGLLGRNGCGKSTLLAAIAGDIGLERGSIDAPTLRIARLSQHPPAGTHSLIEHVLRADSRRESILQELAQLENAASPVQGDRIAQLHGEFDEIDGWTAPARAARLLDGLGFAVADHERPVDSLSGGWKMRLDLARVLMTPADLLLLDEPTNHLDLDAVFWLEKWLLRFPGTVLVVSHDRDFVDAFATAVLHFEHQRLTRYSGGWSAFEHQRAERQRLQRKLAEGQANKIAHLEHFIARFRAQATKAKQAQSRIKALERLERVAVLEDEQPATMRFDSPDQMPEQIASLVKVDCGYAGPPASVIVGRAQLDLRRGDRIGVLGRNGAGKSTLVRTLVGDLTALAGERTQARGLRVGYFAQRQVETLDAEASVLLHLRRIAPDARESVLREYAAGFGFRGDQALAPVGPFSGGEKARLALALIAWTRPQLLILDEPTNHLDASARDALTAALAQYEGALLLVSHDRGLLRATVDRFVIVADRTLAPFDGDLDDYRDWLARRSVTEREDAATAAQTRRELAAQAHDDARGREEPRLIKPTTREQRVRQRKPLQTQLTQVERDVARLQTELEALDLQLIDPQTHRDAQRAVAAQQARAVAAAELERLEERWLSLAGELEALGSD